MTITKKRNLFEELKQGIQEIKNHKAKKIILRSHKVKKMQRSAGSVACSPGKKIS
ncbi:MAG TPA: hypothetical protein VLJ15_00615 [Gammaproteobacteria bacterium]|nr:hypothetical protein [Gammaproteobacteria bacterium]